MARGGLHGTAARAGLRRGSSGGGSVATAQDEQKRANKCETQSGGFPVGLWVGSRNFQLQRSA